MVLWRAELRISWLTQLFSRLVYGGLAVLVLLSPWPEGAGALWLVLLVLMLFECTRSQKNIAACRGELCVYAERWVSWQQCEWQLTQRPWMLGSGVMLYLREKEAGERQRLWIAADSVSREEWRALRQLLLQQYWDEE